MSRRRARGERGSMTVAMTVVVAVGLAACWGAARLGAAAVGRARATVAADAAALAAADLLALGEGAPAAVAAARETAEANGARLTACECSGRSAAVRVVVPVGPLGVNARAEARAVVRPECRFGCP